MHDMRKTKAQLVRELEALRRRVAELERRAKADITDRRTAELALRRSEERYRTIFEITGTAMIGFGEDKIITLANEQWATLTGYSVSESVGKLPWSHFFSEESRARMTEYHEMRSRDPASVPGAYEAPLVSRDGKVHDGIVNIAVVPGTQERVASFSDLTELKQAQQQVYRADKMAALGQIMAGVAHEINNPNNFVFFNLPILKQYLDAIRTQLDRRAEVDPEMRLCNMSYEDFLTDVYRLVDNMQHGASRIAEIVAELKEYVGSSSDERRKVQPVRPVIESAVTLVGKQVRKMVGRFEVRLAADLGSIEMNAGKIEQVLINLVVNAAQAADKKRSWVRLSAERHPSVPDRLLIEVEDNGSGIPPEILGRIFDPFFTTKGREVGTGLGLAISSRIIEDHHGTLRVASTPGEGSCFTVELPQVAQ